MTDIFLRRAREHELISEEAACGENCAKQRKRKSEDAVRSFVSTKMYDKCKITRSVRVKGSFVSAGLVLTIYTLLRHGRTFAKESVGERAFSASEKSRLTWKLERRFRHKVHMEDGV